MFEAFVSLPIHYLNLMERLIRNLEHVSPSLGIMRPFTA
jgi:hypothetical protein